MHCDLLIAIDNSMRRLAGEVITKGHCQIMQTEEAALANCFSIHCQMSDLQFLWQEIHHEEAMEVFISNRKVDSVDQRSDCIFCLA